MPIRSWLNAFLAAFSISMAITPAAVADDDSRTAPTAEVESQSATSADATRAGAPNCLLPGQIRSFGGIAMATPRRTATLPKPDCAARGGEPITAVPD